MGTSDPWIEYCAHGWNTYSWNQVPLHGRIPPISWAKIHQWDVSFPWMCKKSMDMLNIHGISMDLLLLLALYNIFTTSPTPPAAAALIIIHHIIALASDSLAYFITSLSLGLLGLNLIFCSMITLGSHCHC